MKGFILILLFILLILFSAKSAYAWLDCPFRNTNDPYPGKCFRYADTDNDGLCDYSQSSPENRESLKVEASATEFFNNFRIEYWFILIPAFFYLIHWCLSEKIHYGGKFVILRNTFFRAFWDLVLLLSFLVAGFTALMIAFVPDIDKIYVILHIRVGLAMVVTGFLHFLYRARTFRNLIKASIKT